MTSMLDQAIVDAQALREAALKNAEQAIIEKYAPEIKSAVESLLEGRRYSVGETVYYKGAPATVVTEEDDGQVGIREMNGDKSYLVQESDLQETGDRIMTEADLDLGEEGEEKEKPTFEEGIPAAATDGMNEMCGDNHRAVSYDDHHHEPDQCPCSEDTMLFEFTLQDFQEDVEPIEEDAGAVEETTGGVEEPPAGEEGEMGGIEGLLEEDDDPLNEIMALLEEFNEEEIIEEDLVVDMGEAKAGHFVTNEAELKYQQEMQLAMEESTALKEENEELEERLKALKESLKKTKQENKKFSTVIVELNKRFQETLLSNAKLIYSNRTLSDASLNERQKVKIVEAISKARSVEEAKNLQETLKVTVGSSVKKGPQSLNESISRRSNLSSMISRSNNNKNNKQVDDFSDRMKRLAGIN